MKSYVLSANQILKNAWSLFMSNFREIVSIALIVAIPISLIASLYGYFNPFIGRGYQVRIDQLLDFFIGVIATIAIIIFLSKKINNTDISIQGALSGAMTSLYGRVLLNNIVLTIYILGLMLLLIIPGLIFSIYWSFAMTVMILYNKNMKESRVYSYNLVKGRWWKVALYSLYFGLIFILCSFIVGFIIGLVSVFIPSQIASLPDFSILGSLITNILISVIWSFFIVVSFVFFITLESNRLVSGEENNTKV